MPTARTLVTDGLSLIGVQAAEEPLTAHQEQQGLRVLNDLIQSASLEQFVIYYMRPEVIPWAAGRAASTWGPGGDIPTVRPLQIGMEAFRDEGVPVTRTPVAVLTPTAFREMAQGVVRHGPVLAVTYTPDLPLGGVHCWPVPQEPTTIIVYPWTVLTTWPDFDTDLLLPPGYDRYLKSGVACELAPYYEKEPSPLVLGLRAEAKNNIKVVNLTIPVLDVPHFADPFLWQRG
jgi:hypothetical protein